jgi:5-formaminoimidazole-4-carboxamide-1-beta-D-ribofuranosyl 5'-monophosphate synthetase
LETNSTNQNLKENVDKWFSLFTPEKTKYGADEAELKLTHTPKAIERILKKREKEGYYDDDKDKEEVIQFLLVPKAYKVFHFFYYHCSKRLYEFGGMGGYLKFNWDELFKKAEKLKINLKPKHVKQLEFIEDIVIPKLNELSNKKPSKK